MKFFERAHKLGYKIPDFSGYAKYFPNTNCKILDGKLLRNHFIKQSQTLLIQQSPPCLAVILVGKDPASQVYVNNKVKTFTEAGFSSKSYLILEEEANTHDIIKLILNLNNDHSVHGILVQLPLPRMLNQEAILNSIHPTKDVDGFLATNLGSLATGEYKSPIACTPLGVMLLLYAYGYSPVGKHAVVIGKSNIVGKPMGLLLLGANATVTTVHTHTKNIENICKQADILIAAAGCAKLVTPNFVKQDAVVIDIGIHKTEDGKLCGDVHEDVKHVASALSPVPGGVGPMTIAMLLLNTALTAWS